MTEAHPQIPVNPYGHSKLMVERILTDYAQAYGLRALRIRYFNAAGSDPDCEIGEEHEPESHLIPNVLRAAAGRSSHVSIFGTDYPTPDGTAIRDYVHVCDLVAAHVLALSYLKSDGARVPAVNLGSGVGFSVRQVIQAAERVTNKKISTVLEKRRPGDRPRS